ncbi:MAG: hypothetical protein IPO09_13360 [Anaeromyxobacter sp.]|nr:hypothetical protein [Anaeromyxobacter sp.]MBL0275174.1 hypothetical protein [Anaeromyxobacter sp.]
MLSCPRVSACPLFAQFTVKASLRLWQAYYCDGSFDRCERYQLAATAKPVPSNLLPNGRLLDVPMDQLEARHLQ